MSHPMERQNQPTPTAQALVFQEPQESQKRRLVLYRAAIGVLSVCLLTALAQVNSRAAEAERQRARTRIAENRLERQAAYIQAMRSEWANGHQRMARMQAELEALRRRR